MFGKIRVNIWERDVKILSEELKQAIQEKQSACHKYLQTSEDVDQCNYKQKRNAVKYVIRGAHDKHGIGLLGIEDDILGRQMEAYK